MQKYRNMREFNLDYKKAQEAIKKSKQELEIVKFNQIAKEMELKNWNLR